MASKSTRTNAADTADRNANPITDEAGTHPVGVGLGAAAAGAAGAVAGPIGAVVGAVAGAVAGGYAGKGISESVDPTVEDAYWRENHTTRPYHDASIEYDYYAPAYKYGWESRAKYADKSFAVVERDLERGWNSSKPNSRLTWNQAKLATEDTWDRAHNRARG